MIHPRSSLAFLISFALLVSQSSPCRSLGEDILLSQREGALNVVDQLVVGSLGTGVATVSAKGNYAYVSTRTGDLFKVQLYPSMSIVSGSLTINDKPFYSFLTNITNKEDESPYLILGGGASVLYRVKLPEFDSVETLNISSIIGGRWNMGGYALDEANHVVYVTGKNNVVRVDLDLWDNSSAKSLDVRSVCVHTSTCIPWCGTFDTLGGDAYFGINDGFETGIIASVSTANFTLSSSYALAGKVPSWPLLLQANAQTSNLSHAIPSSSPSSSSPSPLLSIPRTVETYPSSSSIHNVINAFTSFASFRVNIMADDQRMSIVPSAVANASYGSSFSEMGCATPSGRSSLIFNNVSGWELWTFSPLSIDRPGTLTASLPTTNGTTTAANMHACTFIEVEQVQSPLGYTERGMVLIGQSDQGGDYLLQASFSSAPSKTSTPG
eukprot:TRINITY_DN804_c0_g1_i1.p1 TRINITY_DN804_c0_g1~~TRINITY_DN804_c0_g1_i1.p1  ORF type:complete len:474 (-),score=62.52 TRINITY_DN804_c0_g1_i1:1290-2606(-)